MGNQGFLAEEQGLALVFYHALKGKGVARVLSFSNQDT